MIYCDYQQKKWIECALKYLPDEIYNQIEDNIAFTILKSDGFRLGKKVKNHKEVIVLSPWIFPSSYVTENHTQIRYLIFCILHEVAHAICNHHPPDEISSEENNKQEKEATTFAYEWYNRYVKEYNADDLKELTEKEILKHQEKNQNRLKKFLEY